MMAADKLSPPTQPQVVTPAEAKRKPPEVSTPPGNPFAHADMCQCIGCRHDRAVRQTTKGHSRKPPPGRPVRSGSHETIPASPVTITQRVIVTPEELPRDTDERACRGCGVMFEPGPREGKRLYCSGACKLRAFRVVKGQVG